jgi:hypothetical protein
MLAMTAHNGGKAVAAITYSKLYTGGVEMKVQAGMVVGRERCADEERDRGSDVGNRPNADALGVEDALELNDGTVAAASRSSWSGVECDENGSSSDGSWSKGGVWCSLRNASSKMALRLRSVNCSELARRLAILPVENRRLGAGDR